MTNEIVYTVPDELLNEDIYSTIRSDLQKYWTPKAEAPKELTQLPTDQQLTKEQIDLLKAYQQFVVNLANELKNVGKFGSIGLGIGNNKIKALLQQIVVLFQNVNVIAQQTQIKINEAKKITRKVAPNAEITVDISGLFKKFQINDNKKEQFINTLKNIINDIMKGIKTELQFFINIDKEETTAPPTEEEPQRTSQQLTNINKQAIFQLKTQLQLIIVSSMPNDAEHTEELKKLINAITDKLDQYESNENQAVNITLNEAKVVNTKQLNAKGKKPSNKKPTTTTTSSNNNITPSVSQPTEPTVSAASDEQQETNGNNTTDTVGTIELDLTSALQKLKKLSKYKQAIIEELIKAVGEANEELKRNNINFNFTVKNKIQQLTPQEIKDRLTPQDKSKLKSIIKKLNENGILLKIEQALEILGLISNIAGFMAGGVTVGLSAIIGALPDIMLACINGYKAYELAEKKQDKIRFAGKMVYNIVSTIPGGGAGIKGLKLIIDAVATRTVIGKIFLNLTKKITNVLPFGDKIYELVERWITFFYGLKKEKQQIQNESKIKSQPLLTEAQIKRWQTLANI
jgi:hypothetical protein